MFPNAWEWTRDQNLECAKECKLNTFPHEMQVRGSQRETFHKPKLNSQTFQVSKIFESRFGPLNLVQFGPCWKSLKKSYIVKWGSIIKTKIETMLHTGLNDKKLMLLLALCLCFYNKKKLASIHRVGLFDQKVDSSNGYKCNQTFIEWKMDCLNFL